MWKLHLNSPDGNLSGKQITLVRFIIVGSNAGASNKQHESELIVIFVLVCVTCNYCYCYQVLQFTVREKGHVFTFFKRWHPTCPSLTSTKANSEVSYSTMTMLLVRPVVRSSAARRMSTVAASTVSSDVPSYISEAPAATVSTLGNGVTVASLYNADG